MEEKIIATGDIRSGKGRVLAVSIATGAAASYIAFVLFLQTSAISLSRLALAGIVFLCIGVVSYTGTLRWLASGFNGEEARRAVFTGLILSATFVPLLFEPPAYPQSPLLQPWTDLAIQFELSGSGMPLILEPGDLKFTMGKETVGAASFQPVGTWQRTGNAIGLSAGETGSLQWTGTTPETLTLSIQPHGVDGTLTVYWDNTRTTFNLSKENQAPIVLVRKVALPWGYSLAFLASLFILTAWVLSVLTILAERRLGWLRHLEKSRWTFGAIAILFVALSALTVKLQVDSLSGGVHYILTTQVPRHTNVLNGLAPNPWQYRVLSEWVAELFLRFYGWLSIPDATVAGFLSLRLLQNIIIFVLAFLLYKRLSRSSLLALLGILVLAASMHNAYYDNDLAFNTYFDILFYLLCALLLLSRNYRAVLILTVLAALNRETSALIPFLMGAAILEDARKPGASRFLPVLIAAALFVSVFLDLRWLYPGRPIYVPYKHPPGFPLFLYNISRQFTWEQLLRTLGLIPLLGLLAFPAWPRLWRWFFLIVCPVWFLIHSFASVMAETRLFLVPQALVFIPGVLFLLMASYDRRPRTSLLPELDAQNNEPR
ncbi:MAG TPA: hypothetical protein VF784_13020 [Anaerolineales bacterium]